MADIRWATATTTDDIADAGRFLSFAVPAGQLAALAAQWRAGTVRKAEAKDILRAAGLTALPSTSEGVRKHAKAIRAGETLDPVLIVNGDLDDDRPAIVAEGYHRLSAVYNIGEDELVAVLTADLDTTGTGPATPTEPGEPDDPDEDNDPPEPPDHDDEPGEPAQPGSPPSGSGTAKYPADICGPLWKVTIPTSTNGKVDEVKPPAFATYSSKFFELTPAKDGIVFRVWHGGDTTQSSKNPRSELRERWDNDPEGYWNAASGRHTLTIEGQVNRLTKVKPHVVLGQYHNEADDVWVWRLEGDKLYITNYNETHAFLVDGNYRLGTRYKLEAVMQDGVTTFRYNGQPVAYTAKATKSTGYFKAGNYLQSNPSTAPSESTSEYAEVVLYAVAVSHS
jgi:Alginate lyase